MTQWRDNEEGHRGISKIVGIYLTVIILVLVGGGLLWWIDAYILHT